MNESQLMLIEEKDKEIERLKGLLELYCRSHVDLAKENDEKAIDIEHYRDAIKGYRSANDYNVKKINKLVSIINELKQ